MPMLFTEHLTLAWIAFTALILILLALDLGLFHRRPREVRLSEALLSAAAYILLALCFNAWLYWQAGRGPALQFLTGYFIEYALSMDNILVFVVIFSYFQVPPQYQMRALLWGVIGSLILRAAFILAGLALIEAFDWMVIVLGLFLIYTGIRTMRSENEPVELEKRRIVRLVRRFIPVTPDYRGDQFFAREAGKTAATPLFLVLVVLNVTDILFAVDSVPAVFAITRDPFIVFTSNVFAILGLRSLYFALSRVIDKFTYLKLGLSLVLIFIGIKMIYNYPDWLPDIPTEWALGITAALIFGSILASLVAGRPGKKRERANTPL